MGRLKSKFDKFRGFKTSVDTSALFKTDGAPVTITAENGSFSLVLEGAATPEQGIAVRSRLLTNKVHYPGSFDSSIHIMGTAEDDITFTGVLSDMQLGAGFTQEYMFQIRQAFNAHIPVRINGGPGLKAVGVIKEIQFEVIRTALVKYEIVFEIYYNVTSTPKRPKNGLKPRDASVAALSRDIKKTVSVVNVLRVTVDALQAIRGIF